MNEREAAFEILERVEQENAYASLLVGHYAADSRAGNLIRTLTQGVLRWRSRLDYIAETLSGRPLRKIDPRVRQILRLAIFEMAFTGTPAHAAVNESVKLAAARAPRAKGFVNAVLRKAARENLAEILPEGTGSEAIAIRYAHPLWLVERWLRQYGAAKTVRVLEANQTLSKPDILINTTRISVEDARGILTRDGVAFTPSELLPNVLRLHRASSHLERHIAAGYFHPMDEGSVAVASLTEVEGQRVLDLAAAPGGKSLVMTLRGASVVSHDRSLVRLLPLRRSFRRMFGSEARIVSGNALRAPFRMRFETVLLDAPCSATGTIRKNPELKWRLRPKDIGTLARNQISLLESALALSGTTCIYATCSLEPEENDGVIEIVAQNNSHFALSDLGGRAAPPLRKWIEQKALRLTPDGGTDGFTAYVFQRR